MTTKLRPGEKKVLETRTHWITVVGPFLLVVVALTIFFALLFGVRSKNDVMMVVRWAGGVFLALALISFAYREIYRRRDIWVVTNFRVIDEKGVFSLYSKESPLEKINNLSYSQSVFGRILHYGDIEIQTAAEDGATVYKKVTNPRLLKDTIATCREEYSRDVLRAARAPAADSKSANSDSKSG